MLTVQWPSTTANLVEAWRLLDLSGMTNSVRESRNFTLAGYFYADGVRVTLKYRVPTGTPLTLELRFPNGKIVRQRVFVANRMYLPRRQRSNTPRKLNYRG